MKNLKGLTILMSIAMVVVSGFQVWWLMDSYNREKHSVELKANIHFQETVHDLQVQKLKIPGSMPDSGKRKMRVFVSDNIQDKPPGRMMMTHNIITTVNTLRNKISDSLKQVKTNSAIVILKSNFQKDSLQLNTNFQYLYGVDSLQDTLKLPEINTNYKKALRADNMDIPFSITRLDSAMEDEDPGMSDVTTGFVHPVTYHLELGNIFPFVVKKLSLPILFSLFLIAVTVLSFSVLYRNILRQQRLAEMKNDLISNITHELKTPLATVGVAIEAMKNFNALHDQQKTKEYLDISASELQRLSLLVDKVLKLSMFEKKQIELKYEQVDLKEIVDEVVNSMRLQIEKCKAKVSVTAEGNILLSGDRLHLLSVIFNLLDNALKYCKAEPSITIAIREDQETLHVDVADNGIGIAPEFKGRVFEKFFRVPTGNRHDAKGYGLGLSYVAHVVQKHNGSISVTSEEGKGSIFSITFPKHQKA